MKHMNWIIQGGIAGALLCSALAVLMLAWTKRFTPASVHTSWAEMRGFVIVFCVPVGVMVGGGLGYMMAPLSEKDRTWFVIDLFIMVAIILISQELLRKVWSEPNEQHKFLPDLTWQLVPLIPASIYYHWLGYLIR